MIIDYSLLGDSSMVGLSGRVREAIAKGWQPVGPAQVAVLKDMQGAPKPMFYQTIIKYEKGSTT